MRKIEQALVAAIRAGTNWASGNTRVTHDDTTARVYLHDNLIAEIGGPNGTRWTLAGWNTPTTRSRINALARAFNWKRSVFTRNGKAYAWEVATSDPGTAIDADQWVDALGDTIGSLSRADRLEALRDSRSATWALICKAKAMRGDDGDDHVTQPYRGGPICPRYTVEDVAKYERELADLDRQIAALA